MLTKRCSACGSRKPTSAFHKNRARPDGLQVYCKDCKRARDRAYYHRRHEKERLRHNHKSRRRRKALKQQYLKLLENLACIDCGESHPAYLDFDHVRGEKRMAVSNMLAQGYRWALIEAEIAKCEVRCANCHRKKTARDQSWYAG